MASVKKQLLTSSAAAEELTADFHCPAAAAALQALWAEVRRCQRAGTEDGLPVLRASVDYEACLAALGGAELQS